jgi:hypothetical protein
VDLVGEPQIPDSLVDNGGKMRISEIKKKMLEWEDFYGADIFERDRIEKAETKEDLDAVLHDYSRHMEARECDARGHFEKFRNSLGLTL